MTTPFDGSEILVTGGTGSFGQTIVRQLLDAGAAKVNVLSRDEAKQDSMRDRFSDKRLVFITGDVRDASTVTDAMKNVDFVFHTAALKQVPNCERFPMEAVRTNIIGSENIRVAAMQCRPASIVSISTDKACSPINTMGLSKAIMEKILLQTRPYDSPWQAHGRNHGPRFVCVRYGNIMGSRGSVIPLFFDRIRRGQPLPITNKNMTRFILRLPEAVETALDAAVLGEHGELWVKKMPSTTVGNLIEAIAPPGYPTIDIGIRPGEKMHEVLVNEDEMRRAEDRKHCYVIDRNQTQLTGEYTSANAEQISVENLRELLQKCEVLPS